MAAHLESLKRKPAERKSDQDGSLLDDKPFFPLSLYVTDPEIEKLGIGGMEIGDERILIATVKASSISINEDEDSKRTSMSLTLTEGHVENMSKSQAEKLFGES